MNINLSDKISTHFDRLETMANEAAIDDDESFSSRSSAMRALTDILQELTKAQAEVINMERLMKIEKITVDTVKKHLNANQQISFLADLESSLDV